MNGVYGVVPIASLRQDIREFWNTSNALAVTRGSSSDGVCLNSEQAADRESSVFMFISEGFVLNSNPLLTQSPSLSLPCVLFYYFFCFLSSSLPASPFPSHFSHCNLGVGKKKY